MLDEEMRYFLEYCRISDFSKKSIESLSIRLNEFNEFLKTTTVTSLIDISYQHLRRFIGYRGGPLVLHFIDPSVYSRYPALFSHRALLKNLPLIRKGSIFFIIQPYSCQDLLPPNSTIIAISKLQN